MIASACVGALALGTVGMLREPVAALCVLCRVRLLLRRSKEPRKSPKRGGTLALWLSRGQSLLLRHHRPSSRRTIPPRGVALTRILGATAERPETPAELNLPPIDAAAKQRIRPRRALDAAKDRERESGDRGGAATKVGADDSAEVTPALVRAYVPAIDSKEPPGREPLLSPWPLPSLLPSPAEARVAGPSSPASPEYLSRLSPWPRSGRLSSKAIFPDKPAGIMVGSVSSASAGRLPFDSPDDLPQRFHPSS
jgi:hypothetical protein